MYSDAEKLIYCCTVGGQQRRYDPLAVRRRLLIETAGQFELLRAEYEGDDEMASLAAEELLLPAVRAAFRLTPIADAAAADEATDGDALELLYDYLDFVGKPKSADATGPTSSQPSGACRS